MADLDVTKKLHVYHLLHRLNVSFAAIVRRCRQLQETRVFRGEFLRVYEGYAQELQAEINFELVETLQELESYDWYRYGKVRQKREKELRDPNDVFIHASHRLTELRRQGKKSPRSLGELKKQMLARRRRIRRATTNEGLTTVQRRRRGRA